MPAYEGSLDRFRKDKLPKATLEWRSGFSHKELGKTDVGEDTVATGKYRLPVALG